MRKYEGVFAELLTSFIFFKRSQGFKYNCEADALYKFLKFTTKLKISKPVLTKKIVEEWVDFSTNEGFKTNWRIVHPLRQFSKYLHAPGHKTYIPTTERRAHRSTFIPYIFTHSEIERIFANSDQLCPRRFSTIPIVIPVILRILYSCGLRISEAVKLRNTNVDLQTGILEIKDSKFGKDRLVPMSQSMVYICGQ